MQRSAHRQTRRRQAPSRHLLHQRRARPRVGRPGHSGVLCPAAVARLSRSPGHSTGQEVIHPRAGATHRRDRWTSSSFRKSIPTAATSAWLATRCGGRTGVQRHGAVGTGASVSTSIAIFPSCGNSTATSRRPRWQALAIPPTTRPTWASRGFGARDPQCHLAYRLVSEDPLFGRSARYGETMLHSWGSDENESNDPGMYFRIPAYDGRRGLIHDDAYHEYVPAADQRARATAATVHGGRHPAGARTEISSRTIGGALPDGGFDRRLRVQPSLRHPSKPKIIAFTMEWGRTRVLTRFPAGRRNAQGHARGHCGSARVLPAGEIADRLSHAVGVSSVGRPVTPASPSVLTWTGGAGVLCQLHMSLMGTEWPP